MQSGGGSSATFPAVASGMRPHAIGLATEGAAASNLFSIRRIFALVPPDHDDGSRGDGGGASIAAMAVHTHERTQLLALAVTSSASDAPHANYLLVRSFGADNRARFWRFPLSASRAKQQQLRTEPVAALAFSPEGDWLACLSTRKTRLHLLPVARLVSSSRKTQLEQLHPPSHNREWMGVRPSVMTAQMASYLRATNEAGGLNGARYKSRVAGDDEQMSTLEFAVGLGAVTCLCWWRSMNGKNYCLVGGAESIISIVNVEDNAEECRCELQNAGKIVAIDLFHEKFRKEKRTSMLVRACAADSGITKYFRIVLEKKTLQPPPANPSTATATMDTVAETRSTNQREPVLNQSGEVVGAAVKSASESVSGSNTSLGHARGDTYVVKTFPEHFVEDIDFRPQRIKKNDPDVRLCAINSLHSSESALAMYDPTKQRVNIFSNFQWTPKGQYSVPQLLSHAGEPVVDIDLTYCSSDLMLLQGKSVTAGGNVSSWVSLPSRPGLDEQATDEEAHIVHYLSLHGNEKVECVFQTTSQKRGAGDDSGAEAEIIYVLQTKRNVYECHPQWSRLTLFRALRAQKITLRDALSIGFALGIDMASLCEVVADTICADVAKNFDTAVADEDTLQWVHGLFEVSRATPPRVVEQLTSIGGPIHAILFAKGVLKKRADEGGACAHERERLSLQVVDLILQHQVQNSFAVSHDEHTLRPRDPFTQAQLEKHESWLTQFLCTNRDYNTHEMVELCLTHHQVERAVSVGISRAAVTLVLRRLEQCGLATCLSKNSVRALIDSKHTDHLLHPDHRLLLRGLSYETQVQLLLAHPSSILAQRDWIIRHLAAIPKAQCTALALAVDPRKRKNTGTGSQSPTFAASVAPATLPTDVSSSEFMPVSPEEHVEMFLTLLLRANSKADTILGASAGETSVGTGAHASYVTQSELESLLRELAFQFRPPVMIARCVDFENWSAAAALYEAHGELIDTVECRLHAHRTHRRRRASSSLSSSPRSRGLCHSSRELVNEEENTSSQPSDGWDNVEAANDEMDEDAAVLDHLRVELLELLTSLVVNTATASSNRTDAAVVHPRAITVQMRAAILARLLVKWFEYGLDRADLEMFLIDGKVFNQIAAPLSQIFFAEIMEHVGGRSGGDWPSKLVDGGAKIPASTCNNPDVPPTHSSAGGPETFDERDKEWLRQCHLLPFSGQFLFQVCMWFLENADDTASPSPPAATSVVGENASVVISDLSRPLLVELVKENIDKNDLLMGAVRVEPHSAHTIGKSDPLETHVKVFTCGHVFPKRVFDEEVLPEFEKRMNALPMPLLSTKQMLLAEFKRPHVEAPCPVCAYNKIRAVMFIQRREPVIAHTPPAEDALAMSALGSAAQRAKKALPPHYFLHRRSVLASGHLPAGSVANASMPLYDTVTGVGDSRQRQHAPWEWVAR